MGRHWCYAMSQAPAWTIRHGRTGDLGWMFHRQAVVYEQEFGYTPVFERYVCRGLPSFLDNFDAALDRIWMAEISGAPVGFVAIQHEGRKRAKLRWLLVEASARGTGLGQALLEAAVRFCREAGYESVFLWTVDDLPAAARLYQRAGFVMAEQKDGCPWSSGNEQRWELALTGSAGNVT